MELLLNTVWAAIAVNLAKKEWTKPYDIIAHPYAAVMIGIGAELGLKEDGGFWFFTEKVTPQIRENDLWICELGHKQKEGPECIECGSDIFPMNDGGWPCSECNQPKLNYNQNQKKSKCTECLEVPDFEYFYGH